MKILFICSSLEPGKDGVGDYSRRLASELILQGHQACIIALHDKHLKVEEENAKQIDEQQLVPVLRLSLRVTWKTRVAKAEEFLTSFSPDWVSLQYVPYGFQKKGVPFGLGKRLRKIGGTHRWHVMYHELWVGAGSESSLKIKILSFLQKLILKQVVSSLGPAVMHTHLPIYQDYLQEIGFTTHSLPLFSTIIINKSVVNEECNSISQTRTVTLGFFSQVGGNEQMASFLTKLHLEIIRRESRLEIILMGGSTSKMNDFKEWLESLEGLQGKVSCSGFLTDGEISAIIGNCDLGISPVPRHGLGKSTSVAAFITQGIPVAAPVIDSQHDPMEIGFFSERMKAAILTEPELGELDDARSAALVSRQDISLPLVAKKLLTDLQQHEKGKP